MALHYDLPTDGFVTLAINDAYGHRVRNLIGAAPRQAGPITEIWDGIDDGGPTQVPDRPLGRALAIGRRSEDHPCGIGSPRQAAGGRRPPC